VTSAAVSYPAAENRSARVGTDSARRASSREYTPFRSEYVPVMKLATHGVVVVAVANTSV
jgi:hypothetical protein